MWMKTPTLWTSQNNMMQYEQPIPYVVVPFQGPVRPGRYPEGSHRHRIHCKVCDDLIDFMGNGGKDFWCRHCGLHFVCKDCMPGFQWRCWHCQRASFPFEFRTQVSRRDELLAAVHDSPDYDDTIHDLSEYGRLMGNYLPVTWYRLYENVPGQHAFT